MDRMSFKLLIPAGLLSALLLLNPAAMAVGLGPVEVDTHLNEPLRAEIPLLSMGSVASDEIEVSLASPEEFARVGIDRPGVLTQLKFEIAGGDAGPVVRVTSEEPVTEPFLSFLVRVSWPQGRLLREYTVLLDPPVTAPAAAPRPEQAPSQAVRRDEPAEAAAPAAEEPATREPAPARPSEQATGQPGPDARPSGGTYGPVASGETLWNIANRMRPDNSISINQMMLALLRTNPDAFFRDNINALQRGAVLRVPDRGEIERMGAAEALETVRSQNDLWQDYRRNLAQEAPTVVAGGEPQERAQVDGSREDEGSRLELVPPREGEAEAGAARAGPGEGDAEADREALRQELARTREDLLARREQTEQLDGRVDELEAQVDRLQRLLELKNEELAAIQAQGDEADDGDAVAQATDSAGPALDGGEPEAVEPDAEETGADETAPDDAAAPQAGGAAEETAGDQSAAADEAQEPAEPEETETASPPPAPRGSGWLDLLLSPVVLGIAGLLLIGIGVALFLHRRGGGEAQSTVQRESLDTRMGQRREVAAEEREETGTEADEEDFGPPEAGPADYDAAALRAALDENPDDTDTRLKLIRHYAAAGDREAFIAQAETLYADLADPASPAWLETRELGEEIAPDHELFGGSAGDVRSTLERQYEPVSGTAEEPEEHGTSGPEARGAAHGRDTGDEGPAERDSESDLPDLEFESAAPDEPAAEEEPRRAGTETESSAGDEDSDGDREFDLSGLDFGEREEEAADTTPGEPGPEKAGREEEPSDDAFDMGETGESGESGESDEREPMEFDLSDFETGSESDQESGASADDWMTESSDETRKPEAPETDDWMTESSDDTQTPEAPETEPETGGDEAPASGAGDDAVDTKLELAEAYMDMSDEEGAREMLEEVLSEGDEAQQKRAREMLDKLS